MQVYVVADSIVGPLGNTTRDNFDQVLQGNSGIRHQHNTAYAAAPFYAAMMPPEQLDACVAGYNVDGYTKFEKLLIVAINEALQQTAVTLTDKRTGFIISTTKGNIELIDHQVQDICNMQLFTTAKKIYAYFQGVNQPLVISSACISGLAAIITGKRLIESGKYDHVVIAGADVLTRFVWSGFQSFQAISALPCKPFDAHRAGLTLGEGAAAIILSKYDWNAAFTVGAGAISNDANHISGPSRTGKELATVMELAFTGSGLTPADIDFVSAHGTATLYNDEMEAKAMYLAGLASIPLNSLKGFYGHTLGAAGLIEVIINMHAMKAGVILPTKGYETLGVSLPVNLAKTLQQKKSLHFLKTVSGFGGCNAAMVISLNCADRV